jgi:heterotetrameric sarcosine oxidase gamma subunit
MLDHQPPLDSPLEAHDNLLADEPGFRLQLVETGLLLIQSHSEPAVQEAVVGELGLRLPATGETRTSGDHVLLWLTPAEWILECPVNDTDYLHSALTRRLAGPLAVLTDVSDAFVCFELSGAQAVEVLVSGCSLDLRAANFPSGRVARTSLAGIPTIIRKTSEPRKFRCLVDRSYARHIRDWLLVTTS